jgi:hypothetical protein
MAYDNQGAMRAVTYPGTHGFTRTYSYDTNGNLKTLNTGLVSHSYDYNNLNLLERESVNVDGKNFTLDYAYNSAGHVQSLVYPDGDIVSFTPNVFGQPTHATRVRSGEDDQSYVSTALYYPTGSVKSFNYGNGLTHTTSLNSAKLPAEIKDANASLTALNYKYEYDTNLNITRLTDVIDSHFSLSSLSYDGLDRLTSTTGGSSIGSSSISYDGLGNIKSYTSKDRNFSYDYAPTATDTRANLLRTVDYADLSINYKAFEYDTRGNVIQNGYTSFTYNLANQMASASGGNKTFLYDGHNRRVKKTSVKDDGTETSYSLYSQSGTLLYRETDDGGINYIYLGKKLIAKDGVIPEDSRKSAGSEPLIFLFTK